VVSRNSYLTGYTSIFYKIFFSRKTALKYLQVEWLTKVCCDFMKRHLSVENCLQIIDLADAYHLTGTHIHSDNLKNLFYIPLKGGGGVLLINYYIMLTLSKYVTKFPKFIELLACLVYISEHKTT